MSGEVTTHDRPSELASHETSTDDRPGEVTTHDTQHTADGTCAAIDNTPTQPVSIDKSTCEDINGTSALPTDVIPHVCTVNMLL